MVIRPNPFERQPTTAKAVARVCGKWQRAVGAGLPPFLVPLMFSWLALPAFRMGAAALVRAPL